jgi:hypothetical protein
MRDNHESLPEIINAYERDEHFFCSVALTPGVETRTFEFGIDQESYKAIKRILSLRPFERFPGSKYRYFFSPRVGRDVTDRSKTYCSIRIEQERRGKEFEVAAPESLIANLMWFFKVKDFNELAHLREINKEG